MGAVGAWGKHGGEYWEEGWGVLGAWRDKTGRQLKGSIGGTGGTGSTGKAALGGVGRGSTGGTGRAEPPQADHNSQHASRAALGTFRRASGALADWLLCCGPSSGRGDWRRRQRRSQWPQGGGAISAWWREVRSRG